MVQILFVTGPGGAGSSTVAAATAVQLADAGSRCVLLTTGRSPVAGLDAAVPVESVPALTALEQLWERHVTELSAALPVSLPPASSVVPVPGVSELALLAALARHASGGRTDVVVVDAGPSTTALTLLALPGALRWWLAQAAPPRLRVLATLRAAVVPGRPGGTAAALGAITALEELVGQVPLADPAHTAVHLVLRPEVGAPGELRTTATALAVVGQRVASVTVGRMLPTLPGEWAARRTRAQRDALVEVSALAGTAPVRIVTEAAVPPIDVPALRALDAAVPPTVEGPPGPAARREDGAWVLAVPLPHARRGAVELTRWADDLVLTAAGQRRSVPLDPLLRRCTVSGGALTGAGTSKAVLEVRFTPDPAQWPVGLLEAEETRV